MAMELGVSRKFIHEQQHRALSAVEEAFKPEDLPEGFLGWLPVTRSWIKRAVVSSGLHVHGSIRGICDHVEALIRRPISEGTVSGILQEAAGKARTLNDAEDLRLIREGAHDEIFSQGVPVLAGVEPQSSFLYLLEPSNRRDELAWYVALADKHERQGLSLEVSISDAAGGLRAGVQAAFPNIQQRGDVFHAQMELTELSSYLENRAYARLAQQECEEQKMARAKRRKAGKRRSGRLGLARARAEQAVRLYDEMALLIGWVTEQLALVGPSLAERQDLYDWVLREMEARAADSHRIGPVVTYLKGQRDALLAFVPAIQQDLDRVAQRLDVSRPLVQAVYEQSALPLDDPRFEAIERQLFEQEPARADTITLAVSEVLERTVRASSAVENINSILRGYFFLRRSVGPEFLDLLRFYLNHRRFRRSEHPERVGRSPHERLTGEAHPHWLELLGFPPARLVR
jgi:hypothetical protein